MPPRMPRRRRGSFSEVHSASWSCRDAAASPASGGVASRAGDDLAPHGFEQRRRAPRRWPPTQRKAECRARANGPAVARGAPARRARRSCSPRPAAACPRDARLRHRVPETAPARAWMISKSSTGSRPVVDDTSTRCTSTFVRSRWLRNRWPSPWPSCAPSISPGTSATTKLGRPTGRRRRGSGRAS